MKLYSSFKEILSGSNNLEDYLEENPQYYAHTHVKKAFETLSEHTTLVKTYFERLVEVNKIEPIVDALLSNISFDNNDVGCYLKKLFVNAIVFHDAGKLNPNFQAIKMKNNEFEFDKTIEIDTKHSFLSAYAFISYHLSDLKKSCTNREHIALISPLIFLFSIPILKHHSSFIDKDYDFDDERIMSIRHLADFFDLSFPFENLLNCFRSEKKKGGQPSLWTFFDEKAKGDDFDFFSMYVLLKLNYSLLTASDYYATSEFINDLTFETEEHFGVITSEFRARLIKNFDNNKDYPYNGQLINNVEKIFQIEDGELQQQSYTNLNLLRQKMGAEVLMNIEKFKDDKVFYLEAPTGGGKTNMSMLAIRKLLELNSEINKVFYIFPFTTLITQTAQAIQKTFGLSDNEISQLHSKAGFQVKYSKGDAFYGDDRRNQIDNLFVNYPISLMTHIRFFDVLKSNRKDINYLLHRLANSVVVIDELQSYDPKHWDKIKFFISRYSELFNIRFIVMSATLPKIDKINFGLDEYSSFESLIPNAKKYLQNPNFAKRVEIKMDLLDNEIEISDLVKIVNDKSERYSNNRSDSYSGSVYTIIEFIFKKAASEFYKAINEKNSVFDEIFLLSGTIVEPRRRFIIEYLKDEKNRKKRILLVTTQVVEAGVDIDMDLGFKNQSLIDSDEQLAGRINRNVKKKNCELYLFKYNEPKLIYGNDLRYKKTLEFSEEFIKDILTNKDFDKLYEKVFEDIDANNRSEAKENFRKDYLNHFKRFDFKSVDSKFKLIDSDNCTLFIPLDVPLICYDNILNFSITEQGFLFSHECIENDKVIGEKLWDLYLSIVRSNQDNFYFKRNQLLILNGIMSKFTISLYVNKIDIIRCFLDYNEDLSEYQFSQYLKLNKATVGSDELYDYECGLDDSKLESGFEIF